MLSRTCPPRLAVWVIEKLGVQEPLMGDLLEEWARRRSSAWFWRQTFAVIALATWQKVYAGKLRAVGALFVGWLVLAACALLIVTVFSNSQLTVVMLSWRRLAPQAFLMIALLCVSAALGGWAVMRVAGSARHLVAFLGTLLAVGLLSLAIDTYVVLGRTDLDRSIYIDALPTTILVNFVAMPVFVMLGGWARQIGRKAA